MQRKQVNQYLEFLKLSGIQDIFISRQKNESRIDTKTEMETKSETVAQPILDTTNKVALLSGYARSYESCTDCTLSANRIKLVYGEGSENSKLMIISEAPGRDENISGKPFVGAAGQLLTKMLSAINLQREDIYITNVVKCRPPNNRDPHPEEISACNHMLIEQIDTIQPKVILILGKVAAETLLKKGLPLGKYRVQENYYQGIRAFVTYHPAALLRHSEWKRPTWLDLQTLRKFYENI